MILERVAYKSDDTQSFVKLTIPYTRWFHMTDRQTRYIQSNQNIYSVNLGWIFHSPYGIILIKKLKNPFWISFIWFSFWIWHCTLILTAFFGYLTKYLFSKKMCQYVKFIQFILRQNFSTGIFYFREECQKNIFGGWVCAVDVSHTFGIRLQFKTQQKSIAATSDWVQFIRNCDFHYLLSI